MERQKKGKRLISLTVCLLMVATLMIPMNVSKVSAATTLQNPRTASDGVVTWDCVYFGHYPQSSDGKGGFKNDPIRWRVLWVQGNEAFLFADKILDIGIPYNQDKTFPDLTWETCTIRSWLNGYGGNSNLNEVDYTSDNFINRAFTANERIAILQKTIENADNPGYHSVGGNPTSDKLFLPSIGEMKTTYYGFSADYYSSDSRETVMTAYTAHKSEALFGPSESNSNGYWLRSPGSVSDKAASINLAGLINLNGSWATHNYDGLRPALYLNLNSDLWSYAGVATSRDHWDQPTPTPSEPTAPITKVSQTITAKSFTKTYGNKAFSLGAKAKTKLSYQSSNTKVATVSSTGNVTLKGPGKATITITAAATSQYNSATKKITITVKPKKAVLKKAKSTKKRTLKVMWKRDTKATGYQVVIAQNKNFKKGKKTALIKKNKTTSKTFKKLKSRKNYYYKVRAYKQVGNTKIYGAYSKAKQIKVR